MVLAESKVNQYGCNSLGSCPEAGHTLHYKRKAKSYKHSLGNGVSLTRDLHHIDAILKISGVGYDLVVHEKRG